MKTFQHNVNSEKLRLVNKKSLRNSSIAVCAEFRLQQKTDMAEVFWSNPWRFLPGQIRNQKPNGFSLFDIMSYIGLVAQIPIGNQLGKKTPKNKQTNINKNKNNTFRSLTNISHLHFDT